MKNHLLYFLIFNIFSALSFAQVTNDPDLQKQWWVKSPKENGGVNLEKAWRIAKHNYTPVIAVIDEGFHLDHEDLKGRVLINSKEIPDNNIDDDNNGFVDDYWGYAYPFCKGLPAEIIEVIEKSSISCKPTLKPTSRLGHHGNHVAGIIGATHNNGKGIAGVAKYSKLIPIKNYTFGWDKSNQKSGWRSIESLALSINYAILRGADVINISQHVGKVITDSSELIEAYDRLNEVVAEANRKNIIIVVAAGNDGLRNDSGYFGDVARHYNNIIIVGNSGMNGRKSSYSNYGDEIVHIFAPGSQIYSLGTNEGKFFSHEYLYESGTSMAAPIVSGIIGLILSSHGPQAAVNIREKIMKTSYKFDHLSEHAKAGGVIDAYRALKASL